MGATSDDHATDTPPSTASPSRSAGARRIFVTATVIDAIGTGLWMPFALLFLVHGQGLPLAEAGVTLTTGTLIGIAAGPPAGTILDRIGPVAVLLASNLIRLVAFACYPLAHSPWQVIVVAAVISIGDRLFWTANGPFAATVTTGRAVDTLLGTQSIGRFLGAGLGSGMTAVLPVLTTPGTYYLLAYANAASFAVAAVLIALLRTENRAARGHQRHPSQPDQAGTWRTVLQDRTYVGLCATHLLFALASVGKYAVLPILVTDVLHGPHWVAGTAIAFGTAVFVVAQRPTTILAARYSRGTGLTTAAILFTCSFGLLAMTSAVPLVIAIVVIMLTSMVTAVAEAVFAPLGTAAAAAAAPRRAQGRSSALFQLSWSLANTVGPAMLTGLLAIANPVLWATLAVMTLSAVPALRHLRHRLPSHVLATAGEPPSARDEIGAGAEQSQ
jgi:MFS family permease